jgi:ASC-1-like (ASCH) protein
MRPVRREEILDYVTCGEKRNEILEAVLREKKARRIHIGDHLTCLFENHATVLYQIQEMVRVEQLVREADIAHEIETYNELLPGDGALSATLLIEIDDAERRQELLRRWKTLPQHVYVRLEDGQKIYARFDPRQVGEDRLSSVQYLSFDTAGRVPVAVGADHEDLSVETRLEDDQKKALQADLRS